MSSLLVVSVNICLRHRHRIKTSTRMLSRKKKRLIIGFNNVDSERSVASNNGCGIETNNKHTNYNRRRRKSHCHWDVTVATTILLLLSQLVIIISHSCFASAASLSTTLSTSANAVAPNTIDDNVTLCAYCDPEMFACGTSTTNLGAFVSTAATKDSSSSTTTKAGSSHIGAPGTGTWTVIGTNLLNESTEKLSALNETMKSLISGQLESKHQEHNSRLFEQHHTTCICIPDTLRCDGKPDCADASDERHCDTSNKPHHHIEEHQCSTNEFLCASRVQCIEQSKRCDGIDDCADSSDEHDCRSACELNEFYCSSGECIQHELYCNGLGDCLDGSDEPDECEGVNSTATLENNRLLLPSNNRQLITADSCPPSTHFMCANGLCISELYKCDGDNDCGDSSDERDCDGRIHCRTNEFRCQSGQCINRDWICDGDHDCEDHSDELNCPVQQCSSEQFKCRSGRCIRSSWHCDGDADCEDGSDELGCEIKAEVECQSGNFRCRDGTCIPLAQVCNGAPHCPDGSDEDTNSTCIAGVLPCRENGGPCQHLCVATTNGHHCGCRTGYRKSIDGRSCIDIDECEVGGSDSSSLFGSDLSMIENTRDDVQGCSQLCSNSVPGFRCSCITGYRLHEDKRRCKAISGHEAIYILASNGTFSAFVRPENWNQSRLTKENALDAVSNSGPRTPFDFHIAKNQIFWIDPVLKQIRRALIELSSSQMMSSEHHLQHHHHQRLTLSPIELQASQIIVKSGLQEPRDLTVDWINSRLFWTDFGTGNIEFVSLDGSSRAVLFHDVDRPDSIVADPQNSRIFWTDWGFRTSVPRIESSYMDGSERQVIVDVLLTSPTALVFDHPAARLYWADGDKIEACNWDGSRRFTLLPVARPPPVSLTVFEDELFATFASTESVQIISKLNRNTARLHFRSLPVPSESVQSVSVWHPLRQPEVKQPMCKHSPCSHICLPGPQQKYRCVCPFGERFVPGSQTVCTLVSQSMLLFTGGRDFRALNLDAIEPGVESLAHVLPISGVTFPVAFDLDPDSSSLFWIDPITKTLSRAQWTRESESERLLGASGTLEAPAGIAYDWTTGNLYWSDLVKNCIEVASIKGHRTIVVWRSISKPRALALDPQESTMFWTQWASSADTDGQIGRAGMDGTHPRVVVSHGLSRPQALSLDRERKVLYWTDSGRSVIETSAYDGSERRIFVGKNIVSPYGLAIQEDFLYWSDTQERTIQRVNRTTGDRRITLLRDLENPVAIHLTTVNSRKQTNPCSGSRCSHLCLRSPLVPSFRCACPTGIKLRPDRTTCGSDMQKYLIFTTRKTIRRISLEAEYNHDVVVPIDGSLLKNAMILDVDTTANGTVFWSDTTKNVIFAADITSGRAWPVIQHGLMGVNGLAIDTINRKLYWTDSGRKRVEVSEMNGRNRKALIVRDLDSPRSLAVNPQSGHLVWVDWGAAPKIERADLDGGSRGTLVSDGLGWPNGIAFVPNNGRIVWADSKLGKLEIIDLNGANRRTLVKGLDNPYGVAVIDQQIYWTDWKSKSIQRFHLEQDDAVVEVFSKSLSSLIDIRAIDRESELVAVPSHCQMNNGNCSHLCLRSNGVSSYSCHCPTGMSLDETGHQCTKTLTHQLVLATSDSLLQVSLNTEQLIDNIIASPPLGNISDIATHYERGEVYYTDPVARQIKCLSLTRNNKKTLGQILEVHPREMTVRIVIEDNLGQPLSLAIDPVANNLYWTDEERHTIEVSRLDGSARKILVDLGLGTPKNLVVLPSSGFLFWLNFVNSTSLIERSYLDGSGRMTFVEYPHTDITAMAIDTSSEPLRMYWNDARTEKIQSILVDGSDLATFQVPAHLARTLSFAVLAALELYRIDSSGTAVERRFIESGQEDKLVLDTLGMLRDMKLVVANTSVGEQESSNPCASQNGGCSHLCLFRPHGYVCACPTQPDVRQCSIVPGERVESASPPPPSSLQPPKQPPPPARGAPKETPEGDSSSVTSGDSTLTVNNTPEPAPKSAEKTVKDNNNNNNSELNKSGDGDDRSKQQPSSNSRELTDDDLCSGDAPNKCQVDAFSLLMDHPIVRAITGMGLILLALLVLLCSIIVCVCRRKLSTQESLKLVVPNIANNVPNDQNIMNGNHTPYHEAQHPQHLQLLDYKETMHCNGDVYQLPPPPPPPDVAFIALTSIPPTTALNGWIDQHANGHVKQPHFRV